MTAAAAAAAAVMRSWQTEAEVPLLHSTALMSMRRKIWNRQRRRGGDKGVERAFVFEKLQTKVGFCLCGKRKKTPERWKRHQWILAAAEPHSQMTRRKFFSPVSAADSTQEGNRDVAHISVCRLILVTSLFTKVIVLTLGQLRFFVYSLNFSGAFLIQAFSDVLPEQILHCVYRNHWY